MKRFRVIYLIFLAVLTLSSFTATQRTNTDTSKITLYFVDRQMLRLIPRESYVTTGDAKLQAELIAERLILGKDYNDSIRRIIPYDKEAFSVKLKDGIAYVNINSKSFEQTEKTRINEQLIIYQIVNSLCTVKGISRVKFTIDGQVQKEFFGFMDMREAFVPDYMI